jgi:hypothetical protein
LSTEAKADVQPVSDSDSDRSCFVLVVTADHPAPPGLAKKIKERRTGTKYRSKDADEPRKPSDGASVPHTSTLDTPSIPPSEGTARLPFTFTSSNGSQVSEERQSNSKHSGSRSHSEMGGHYTGAVSLRAQAIFPSMITTPAPSASRARKSGPEPPVSMQGLVPVTKRAPSSYAAGSLPQATTISNSYPQPQPQPPSFTDNLRKSRGSRQPRSAGYKQRSDSPPPLFMSSPPPLSGRTLSSNNPRPV